MNKLECLDYLRSVNSFTNNSNYLLSLFNVSEIDQFIPNFRFDSEKINEDEKVDSKKNSISDIPHYIPLINFELDKGGKIVSERQLNADIKGKVIENWSNKNDHALVKRGKSNFFKILGYVIIGFGWFTFLWEVFLKHLSHVGYAIAMTLIVIAAFSLMNNKK